MLKTKWEFYHRMLLTTAAVTLCILVDRQQYYNALRYAETL